MSHPSRIEDLKRAVQMGRDAIKRQWLHLNQLEESEADAAVIANFQIKLELAEEAHAEDLAELKRLTTN